jgi:hypothetical protein
MVLILTCIARDLPHYARTRTRVVDAWLNMYSVTNLKVADLSIVWRNIDTISTPQGHIDVLSDMLCSGSEQVFDGAPDWRKGCDDHR